MEERITIPSAMNGQDDVKRRNVDPGGWLLSSNLEGGVERL